MQSRLLQVRRYIADQAARRIRYYIFYSEEKCPKTQEKFSHADLRPKGKSDNQLPRQTTTTITTSSYNHHSLVPNQQCQCQEKTAPPDHATSRSPTRIFYSVLFLPAWPFVPRPMNQNAYSLVSSQLP